MADLDMWTNECTLSNFPDDTQSLCISETKESVVDKTTKQANNIMNFFTANDLVNNADKAAILFNSKGKGEDVTIENVGGVTLKIQIRFFALS